MTPSDITTILTTSISICALVVAALSYRRDRNKSNQDFLFQEKILAYKELIFHVNFIFESFFDIMDELLDHEGSTIKWEKFFNRESEYYDSLVTDFYKSIFRALPTIPSDIYKELINFGQDSMQFIDSAFDKNEALTIESHEKLDKSLRNIINLVRKDLNVDQLNIILSNRLK
ncbi:hypothetical protein [Chryseobacterium sp. RLHN22]|uniref:hypothetical protein n=1 Tax=Chryseobacterium sp. RLHN22 TaxID=3437885 RepID=UPI003D9BDA20